MIWMKEWSDDCVNEVARQSVKTSISYTSTPSNRLLLSLTSTQLSLPAFPSTIQPTIPTSLHSLRPPLTLSLHQFTINGGINTMEEAQAHIDRGTYAHTHARMHSNCRNLTQIIEWSWNILSFLVVLGLCESMLIAYYLLFWLCVYLHAFMCVRQ